MLTATLERGDATTSDALARRRQRARAFAAARRHSRFVRFWRFGIVVAAIGGIAGLADGNAGREDAERIEDREQRKAGLNGTKVTMEQPKLAGFRQDGRAYSVTAASSVQDIRNPTIIELEDVTAKVAMADKSNAEVRSPKGVYDTKKEQIDFSGSVTVKSDSGYDLAMRSASFDFRGSILVTREPMMLTTKDGTITADTMQILKNGQQISFEGNVKTLMRPPVDPSSLKGTQP